MDHSPDSVPTPQGVNPFRAFLERLEQMGDEAGYLETFGAGHAALFLDDGPVLLVTFENAEEIGADTAPQTDPRGVAIARAHGWSSLTLLSTGRSWFRERTIHAFFDRLVDDAFFDDFERVVFYGAGPAGYAACAFSVAAPGATVIAVQPQATLAPRIAGWDRRFPGTRGLDFTSRYGYGPEMIESAAQVYIAYDPAQVHDAMHAALYTRAFVTKLPCPRGGALLDRLFAEIGLLERMLIAACEGSFTAGMFWRLWRARRGSGRYLRTVLSALEAAGQPMRAALLCRNVAQRLGGPRFRARLTQIEAELAQRGVHLPHEQPRLRKGL